jgi:hypothetical protein
VTKLGYTLSSEEFDASRPGRAAPSLARTVQALRMIRDRRVSSRPETQVIAARSRRQLT